MPQVESLPKLRFLSELYRHDCPQAWLLAEYPSSNSDETRFQNRSKYIIHDPFPPPPRELIKVLGPHHLMCAWGTRLPVTSELAPPRLLTAHWEKVFGNDGVPDWRPFESDHDSLPAPGTQYITLFPHQSLAANQQVVNPDVNYAIHSKEVIEQIDCSQADVLGTVIPPCIVKLSHGYAGLGNFFIHDAADETEMREQLSVHWPDATLVTNSIIENITDDFGVQFYLRKDGSMVWLGLTEQLFDSNKKWCGGTFSADLQSELFEDLCTMIEPAGHHLHNCGYFGLVGIDILRDGSNQLFLVDVNPRLTGISPFLMASRMFAQEGLTEGIYQASRRFQGSFEQLIAAAEAVEDARVVVLSGLDASPGVPEATTICHLSVSSESQGHNQQVLRDLFPS